MAFDAPLGSGLSGSSRWNTRRGTRTTWKGASTPSSTSACAISARPITRTARYSRSYRTGRPRPSSRSWQEVNGGSYMTPRWSKADSNPRSRSCERDHGVAPKGGLGTTSRVPKSKLRSSRETVMAAGASPRPSRSRRDRDFESRLRQRRVAAVEEAQFTRSLGSPTEENRCRPGRSIRWCASGTLRKPLPPWPRRQPQPHASTALPQRRRPSFPRCGPARSRYGPSPAQ